MELLQKLRLDGRRVRILGDRRGAPLHPRPGPADGEPALVVFAADRSELSRFETEIVRSASADRMTWVAYPKGGQLGTDLSRDAVWPPFVTHGIQVVTSVSIDEVWTGLRFRPTSAVRSRSK